MALQRVHSGFSVLAKPPAAGQGDKMGGPVDRRRGQGEVVLTCRPAHQNGGGEQSEGGEEAEQEERQEQELPGGGMSRGRSRGRSRSWSRGRRRGRSRGRSRSRSRNKRLPVLGLGGLSQAEADHVGCLSCPDTGPFFETGTVLEIEMSRYWRCLNTGTVLLLALTLS